MTDKWYASKATLSETTLSELTKHISHSSLVRIQSVKLPTCWGDCKVCGDRATGKHYGVIACEGCKGFFKRSVRKKLMYTCMASGNCVIDKIQRNRCQRCRLQKCFTAGMNQDAVQCERKPLIVASPSPPSTYSVDLSSERQDRSSDYGSDIYIPRTSPTSSGSSTPPTIETDILTPQHAEFKLYVPSLAVTKFSMDYIYEFATRLLFVSVDWCRSISVFRSLKKPDQVTLLQGSWPELFLLGVSQCIETFSFSPLLSYAAADLKNRDNTQKGPRLKYHVGSLSSFEKVVIVKDFVFSFARLELDPMEYAYLKAIVLFNSDPHTPVTDPKQIESLQEQTHCAFKRYMDAHYPTQPERFAKILLRLPTIRSINRSVVEEIFFAPLIGTVNISEIMENIFEQTQEFCN